MQLENMRCRNCGAELDITKAVSGVVKCEYCESKFTLPKEDITPAALKFLHDGESSLYICRFDDAFAFYKKAAELSPNEPEAYWGMAISQFKVQYIKDEVNDRLQPVCHLVSTENIKDNENYKKAISLATRAQREEYEKQAREIDYIKEEFYKLKQTGKEYDCFICVKVTDDITKGRTSDYKRADDIYFDLKGKGYNPFFSERELVDVTGADYEARILYALYTSECMIVVCGKEEYLHTKWVKNEYTRFLRLVGDEQKESDSITIAFEGRPVEYLPGKNGRIQGIDLRSLNASEKITKFVESHTPEARARRAQAEQAKKDRENELLRQIEQKINTIGTSVPQQEGGKTVSLKSLLMRADASLADRDFINAEAFYNKVLDVDPENGAAWLGLLLVQNKVVSIKAFLSFSDGTIEELINKNSFRLAQKYASPETSKEINSFLEAYRARVEKKLNEERRAEEEKQAKERKYAEQEEAANNARKEYEEAIQAKKSFLGKHTSAGWGILTGFLLAVAFVLVCSLTDILPSWGLGIGEIILICIIGFLIILFLGGGLIIGIADKIILSKHKDENNILESNLNQAKVKFIKAETNFLNTWCDEHKANSYGVGLTEAVKFPSSEQRKIIKNYTGYDDNAVNRILSMETYSDYIKHPFNREIAINLMIDLELTGVKARIYVYS